MYGQLIAIREGFHQALSTALTNDSAGGQVEESKTATTGNEEVEGLRAENKKLKYRITHLLRTIDEIEASAKWSKLRKEN